MKAYNKYEVDEIFSSWQSDLDRLDVIEVYTKSDMVAMLTELKSEIDELTSSYEVPNIYVKIGMKEIENEIQDLIQQKINSLKEGT